ncbi:hypothetical protein BPNPMPFG_000871 [Mesorhizobium sp. AR07]|uniref:hypothetical protein n=1 Tax=Mesorhizobium sp. AR07 TaxID=2865838 RepID=UPI00215E7ECD|nr:hypothetical protein [Mesorhizobium sp. AR07]UVK45344.1 hypothetical protein BPNPMPFG_000871 [Mesorhizobium sp. AR07]
MALVLKLTVTKAEPVLRGQEHVWRVIRTLGADDRHFSAGQVVSVSQEPHFGAVTTFLRRLMLAGFVERVEAGRSTNGRLENRYRLLRSPEQTPRVSRDGAIERPTSARQQMWNIMRGAAGRSGFTYLDLMVLASTEHVPIAANTAKSFIQEIKAAYLLQIDHGGPGRPATWRLRPARNTGPLPPMVLRAKIVFDQNTAGIAGDVIAEEELA